MNETNPTVFIVDGEHVIRNSLTALLKTAGFRCEAFADPHCFLERIEPDCPGCLLLDRRMPGMCGLQLLKKLRERGLEIPVIVLTADADVRWAVAAMQAGADDLVEKPFEAEDLLRRVRLLIDRSIEQLRLRQRWEQIKQRFETLTPREREVLELILEGEPTKRIAGRLGISVNTVRNQRTRIFRKVRVGSVVDLVRMAMVVDAVTQNVDAMVKELRQASRQKGLDFD